jgi:hypothetical protein
LKSQPNGLGDPLLQFALPDAYYAQASAGSRDEPTTSFIESGIGSGSGSGSGAGVTAKEEIISEYELF